ncbi:ArdC-like ssDNA-binding domain-containing protein [Alicyclobacillus fastidiosus]|uniref:ArdC-like ssDNA-binding domain-containing protein n=1 Tax=Alicyclobacillus fastidiosus TaxID=392011 RepID=UPI0023E996D5|nr:ArdC-like ssDNA-binding domain-containing protein [Alicyclobacillus fastidiosus]GMA66112.1 hypothetical protein GCM10025859_65540 [Alicyclobacillus fastidiosus]
MGKRVDETVQRLLSMWESGEFPKVVVKTMLARKAGERPCDAWSLANQILMIVSGTQDARGFNQWQEVGRKVKKGAKALYISGPLKKTITVKDEETGEEKKQQITYGFKDIPVFALEDTEGEPVSATAPNYQPDTFPPLMDVAEAWGLRCHTPLVVITITEST